MKKYVEKLKMKAFSGQDLLDATDNQTKIVRNIDIKKYQSIDELLNPHNCVVILYETRQNYGHWVCVILHKNNVLEFYDPYGYGIDEQLDHIKQDFKNETGQNYPFLSRLFLNSPYNICYNKMRLQKLIENNSSCGRHVALRIIMRNIPLKNFQEIMKTEGGITSDDKATYLTAFV